LKIVSPLERTQFVQIFSRETSALGTNYLTGDFVLDMFQKSGLSYEDLAQIWELSDQDQDGNLDEEEFVLAMYLINAKLRNQLPVIPQEVSPEFRITSV